MPSLTEKSTKENIMQKTFLLVSIALVLAVGFAAPLQAADPVKFGVIEPSSGKFKDIGDRYLAGAQAAAGEINRNGGLLGRHVEIVAFDSEIKPDVATRKMRKAILKDDIKFFGEGASSGVMAAMVSVAQENNAIAISWGAEAASLSGENCSRNFFRTSLNTDMHSNALAKWVADNNKKRVFIIAQDYSFGHEAVAAFKKKLLELNPNVELVGELYHKIGEIDYAPYITQIIAAKPDVIFTSNWGNDLQLLLKQSKPLGLNAQFACYFLNDFIAIRAIGQPDAVIGNVTAEAYMLSIPTRKNKDFVAAYHKANGYYPSWLHAKAYLAVMFWAEAVKKAGTADDVDAVITAWEGLAYDGPAGTQYMRPEDHQAQIPAWVAEIVPKSSFFDHPFVGTPTMISAEDISIPATETGCKGFK
jgi:branched-chain amino acid transport system substrate-binding protein